MVSDFWNEIHIPQRIWKCLVHSLGPALLDGHAHYPEFSLHIDFGVGIVQKYTSFISFDQKFNSDEELRQEHALKINNPQVNIQKPFPDLEAGAKYGYFIFFKHMGKSGLFWSESEC